MEFKKSLVEKYINNQCTPVEAEIVLLWFRTEEGQAYLRQRMDKDWHSLKSNHQFLFDVPLDAKGALEKAGTAGRPIVRKIHSTRGKRNTGIWLSAVAAVSITLVLAVIFLQSPGAEVEHRTAFGETKNIVLPDGSQVMLNGNSMVRYSDFTGSMPARKVWLEGEGYFSVVHDQKHTPFIVHIEDSLHVAVLGTEFNLSARKNKLRVVLDTGKVQLNMKDGRETKKIEMSPGELVEFSDTKPYFIKKEVDPNHYSSWKGGELTFNKTSFEEIAETLHHTYGLSVVVEDDAMLQQKVSGSVPNDNIQKLLHGLALLFSANVEQKEGVVVFTNSN